MNRYQQEVDWFSLYKGNTSRDDVLFTEDSTRHPAKMSTLLLRKILATMQEWEWLETGSCVVDPFGGRGTTAALWCAMHPENRAVTIELEPHFVAMQHANRDHAEKRLRRPLLWEILQGDSRKADELLRESAAGITSPPYGEALHKGNGQGLDAARKGKPGGGPLPAGVLDACYGRTEGNIGNIPDREPCAVTSPPYEGSLASGDPDEKGGLFRDQKRRNDRTLTGTYEGAITSPPFEGCLADTDRPAKHTAEYQAKYWHLTGLGNRAYSAVTSPPYEGDQPCQSQSAVLKEHGYEGFKVGNHKRDVRLSGAVTSPPYEAQSGGSGPASAKGQIGERGILVRHAASNTGSAYRAVTSPPFEGVVATGDPNFLTPGEQGKRNPSKSNLPSNGSTEGQIGATQSETYADACLAVYSALARAGVRYLAVVTKNPTRAGKLRRLDKLTARLLRASGYRIRGWRRAWLYESETQLRARGVGQEGLFPEHDAPGKLKGRLSFFKRIQLAKGGVAAQWEDVFLAELIPEHDTAAPENAPRK